MMQITAAVARQPHSPLSLETVTLDDPRPDEVLVRVVATGVCHSDPAMRDQTYPVPQPVVLGHEGSGIVLRVGNGVTKVAAGDRVLMSYNSCGMCGSCRAGRPGFCHDFFTRNFAAARPDGSSPLSGPSGPIHGYFFGQSSFATHAMARERNVVKVANDAPLHTYCPLGCGIQTGAGAVMNALCVTPGSTIIVFGTGPVGLSAVLAAELVGARQIVAVDLLDARLTLAREFGATDTLNPARTVDVVKALRDITSGGANFTLDTTGSALVVRQATDVLAPRGVCGILGSAKVGTELHLDMVHMMTGGRRLLGTVEGDSAADIIIPQLIGLHERGRFPFDRMITHYDFADINRAIAETESGVCIKAVLRMSEP